MATREKISFCRICTGHCGTILTVDDDDKILGVRGDPDAVLSNGYACFKGLQAEAWHHGPERLLHPLKRRPDGSYVKIDAETAFDEIADKLQGILDRHGPEALAVYVGNGGLFNVTAYYMNRSFLTAFGSDQYFTSVTLDNSSKLVSFGRLGAWAAGFPEIDQMDVALCFGTNPLVSHASAGLLQNDPVRVLKKARANGLKMIVVDPRITETARNADVVLQPYPGQDAAIAGGIAHVILKEGWEDKAFCARHVGEKGMAALKAAVEPLTPAFVERRAGLEPGQIHRVAEMFARAPVSRALNATGIQMMPYSNLAQHMVDILNVICGRFLKAGDPIPRIPMGPLTPLHAEVIPPTRDWEKLGPSRIRGTYSLYGERPSGTLLDEILTPGKGQIRALFLDGGDPMTSFPDQVKAQKALTDIDLLVAIEPWPVPTTHFAHYVIPPLMQYEREDIPMHMPGRAIWPGGWMQYTGATLRPPAGSDLVNDWYVYWSVAKRLGKTIIYNGTPLDMETGPTTDDLLSLVLAGWPFTLEELKRFPHGMQRDLTGLTVLPARPDANGHFGVMPPDVAGELTRFLADDIEPGKFRRGGKTYSHLLSSRRMRDLFNSMGRYVGTVRKRTPYNPAYLNPQDMADMGLSSGDRVELVSTHGRVVAIVEKDNAVKPGVVSFGNGWGALPGSNEDPTVTGSCVNALIDTDVHFEDVNAMPHMTAVPVNIFKIH